MLHQPGDQVNARATAVKRGNHAGDLGGGYAQRSQVFGLFDVHRDQVRLVGQETEEVQRLQHAFDLSAVHHQHATNPVAQHDIHHIAKLVRRTHFNQRIVGQFTGH